MKRTTRMLILVSAMAMALTGCKSIEETLVPNKPDYAQTVMQPMSALEYTNKVSRMLTPLISDAGTYLAHHLDIARGNFPVQEEMALVEKSIDRVQQTIQDTDKLYPPSEYLQHKTDAINALNSFKDALQRYHQALASGSKAQISAAADGIKAASATLKSSHTVYSR